MSAIDPAEVESLVLQTWEFADPAGSGERFRLLAQGHPASGVLLTQYARASGLAGEFETGSAVLDSIARDPADDHLAARIAIERGRMANSSGELPAARPLFEEAEMRARAAGLTALAIDAVHMQSIVAGGRGDHAEAEALLRAALAEADAATDPAASRWRASLLNNLGWTLADSDRWSEALAAFEQAVERRRELGSGVLPARWAQARALRALGRDDEARTIQRELLAEDPADPYVREAWTPWELATEHVGSSRLNTLRARDCALGPRD
ncbi:MAG: tetratricopeptide repeat protein [Nakamurella sp.]